VVECTRLESAQGVKLFGGSNPPLSAMKKWIRKSGPFFLSFRYNTLMHKPKSRSSLRIFVGSLYFLLKKKAYWNFSGILFSRTIEKENLPHKTFTHQSLLFRQLKNTDQHLQINKVTNLKIAIQKLDGLLLKPGETFSYWKAIGRPTQLKGYKVGLVLYNGTLQRGTGGGLCQLSNLLYWMTLHTPLTVEERWRHSYDVFPDQNRTLPFGSGATCAYPNIDLQIKNNTTAIFQLRLRVEEKELVGEWRSNQTSNFEYAIFEKTHKIVHEWWGGYTRHNTLARTVRNKNTQQEVEEIITENHALMMYSPFIQNSN
jgi:vancomycin resistance protein VanW